ncbi:hypothetical protein AB0C62_30505, partial [Streptomyces sp. NPDC048643]
TDSRPKPVPRSGTATSREGQNPRASARGASQWDDGEQKELVAGWVNPLLFVRMAVLIGCLATLAALAYRRHRQQTR